MTILERNFKKKVKTRLDRIDDLYYFTKEAASIRGIADLIICYRGHFIAWELKRSKKEVFAGSGVVKLKGRTTLQYHNLLQIHRAGGVGLFVYPENVNACFEVLTSLKEI